MLHFKTLEGISNDILLETFNDAFSDYIVKMELTSEQLERKLIADSVDKNLSAGVFEDEILIGFILHGQKTVENVKLAYNAGTGVRPSKRGRNLTKAMYDFILPKLNANGIKACYLEVINENIPAIKSYEAIGYSISRELLCFKGAVQLQEASVNLDFRTLEQPDWKTLQSFWDWEPSWQHSITTLRNIGTAHKTIGIYSEDKIGGYVNYNPLNGRIAQIAVSKNLRHKKLGSALLQYVARTEQLELSMINVPATALATIKFLKAAGLSLFITQYEMRMLIE